MFRCDLVLLGIELWENWFNEMIVKENKMRIESDKIMLFFLMK